MKWGFEMGNLEYCVVQVGQRKDGAHFIKCSPVRRFQDGCFIDVGAFEYFDGHSYGLGEIFKVNLSVAV